MPPQNKIKVYQTRELGHAIVRVTDVILLSDHQKAVRNLKRDFLGCDKSQQIKELIHIIVIRGRKIDEMEERENRLRQQLTKKDSEKQQIEKAFLGFRKAKAKEIKRLRG